MIPNTDMKKKLDDVAIEILKGTLINTLTGEKLEAIKTDHQRIMFTIANRYAIDEKNALETLAMLEACGVCFSTPSEYGSPSYEFNASHPENLGLGRIETDPTFNPLFKCTVYRSPEKAIRFLISQGCDINHAGKPFTLSGSEINHIDAMPRSISPLGLAIFYHNDPQQIKLFLDLGANPNPTVTQGKIYPSLLLACYKGSLPIIELLLNAGATIKQTLDMDHPILKLIEYPNTFKNPKEILNLLLKYSKLEDFSNCLEQTLVKESSLCLELGWPDSTLAPFAKAKEESKEEKEEADDADAEDEVAVVAHAGVIAPAAVAAPAVMAAPAAVAPAAGPVPAIAPATPMMFRKAKLVDEELLSMYKNVRDSFSSRILEIRNTIHDIVFKDQALIHVAASITDYACGEPFAYQATPVSPTPTKSLTFMRNVLYPRGKKKNKEGKVEKGVVPAKQGL